MTVTSERAASTQDETIVVESMATATINAPIDAVDLPTWCYTLTDAEYQACSPAHVAAGATTTSDGRYMSINVEVVGGSLLVQHYVEEIGKPDHLKLVSHSDVFTPGGRTNIDVVWELRLTRIDERSCELRNSVTSFAPPELLSFLGQQGIPLEVFQAGRRAPTEAHNRQETPEFAKSIERHALART